MNQYKGNETVNVGYGEDISIYKLAHLIKELSGYTGKLVFNTNMPDGTPRKLLNVEKLNKLGTPYIYSAIDDPKIIKFNEMLGFYVYDTFDGYTIMRRETMSWV